MPKSLSVGDTAPNFDLTSTEDVLLMLCDEVPRTAVILYFCHDVESDEVRSDLVALGRWRDKLMAERTKIMVVSRAKMPALKAVQADLTLRFPLLNDDRNFTTAYGIEAVSEDENPRPAMFLVDRQQRVVWAANPVGGVETAMSAVQGVAKSLQSTTENYPKSVVNRLVDRWVH